MRVFSWKNNKKFTKKIKQHVFYDKFQKNWFYGGGKLFLKKTNKMAKKHLKSKKLNMPLDSVFLIDFKLQPCSQLVPKYKLRKFFKPHLFNNHYCLFIDLTKYWLFLFNFLSTFLWKNKFKKKFETKLNFSRFKNKQLWNIVKNLDFKYTPI